MKKFFAVLPFPILLSLYACASSGVEEEELGNKPVGTIDAGEDAAAPRKDSGPATPPKDSGTGSSSGDAGRDSGTSSSSGGSCSSSGGYNGTGAPQCDGFLKAILVGADLLGGGGAGFATPVASCNNCDPGGGLNCCYSLTGQDFCVDIEGATGGIPMP